ncbi:hypothetical protein F4810DRAFT_704198 [Camillea tinctor]|nr:hypothetical protein F4810DRAFT_704198 [Camillea tinctor]
MVNARAPRNYGAKLYNKVNRNALLNWNCRWLIIRDYGQLVYKTSSRTALLSALEGCILHGDISANNLMINGDDSIPSWTSVLTDLDLAIKEQREGEAGTKTFMAVGALLGEQRSFKHDLESFFWALFWICIHDYGPDGKRLARTVPRFDKWRSIFDERDFIGFAREEFTSCYQPLVPWVNRSRRAIFPNGHRWRREDENLDVQMKKIFQKVREDPNGCRFMLAGIP